MILQLLLLSCSESPSKQQAAVEDSSAPTETSTAAAVDRRQDFLQSIGTTFFVPTYAELVSRSTELYETASSTCNSPDSAAITTLQQKWWAAREPWKQLEILKFGPYKDEPLRLGPKMDFWPVRPNTVDDILHGDLELTVEGFQTLGASAKGFPVLEYLLYQVAESESQNPRFCQYVIAASGDLSYQATQMHKAWDPAQDNYLSHLTDAGSNTESFESLDAALAEVVNRLGHTVENIRVDKLLKPLGQEVGAVQDSKVESLYSHRSLQDIRDNLEGIKTVYYGTEQGLGVHDLLQDRGYDLDTLFETRFNECTATLDSIDTQSNLTTALHVEPDSILYLVEKLGGLQSFIQTDVMGALSLWLTFNDADGD